MLAADLHLAQSHSLKEKRAIIRPILDGARNRFHVAAAEVALQDKWQRAVLGFSAVGGDVAHPTHVIDQVDRFIWSFPDVEVLSMESNTYGWDD